MKNSHSTFFGMFWVFVVSTGLLLAQVSQPVSNGILKTDLNANGHSMTNAGVVSTATLLVGGTNISPGSFDAAGAAAAAQAYSTNFAATNSVAGARVTGTVTNATTAAAMPVSGLAGANSAVKTALANTPNAANGISIAGMNGDLLMNVQLTKVNSAATTVLLEGDSTTYGAGVTDVRQSPAPILSTLGFCINGTAVYRWGWIAWTTYSINSINSTSSAVNFWTGGTFAAGTGTIAPSTLAAPYVIIDAGTNDYYGKFLTATLSTGSNTITGLTTETYLSDGAGHQRVIAVGDQVTGTGITGTATITAIPSGSSVTLSSTPTVNGTGTLTFTPTPTSSTYHTDLANLISNAHTANSGAKVFVATLRPANNTSAFTNGNGAQGDFQASRLVYNTYIKGLTIGGGGANPDGIIDEASMPEFSSFNAAYYYTDQLHPNFAGNQAIARAENAALLGVVPASNLVMQAGSESVPDSSLSNNVALLNQANTFTASQAIGSLSTGGNANLNLYGNETLSGSASNGSGSPTLTINAAGSGFTSQLLMEWGGATSHSNISMGVANGNSNGIPYLNINGADSNAIVPIQIYANNLSNGNLIGVQYGKYNSPSGWYIYEYFIPGGSTSTNVGLFGCGGGGFCQYGNGPCIITNGSTANNGYQLEVEGLGTEKVDSTLTVAGAINSTSTLTVTAGSVSGSVTLSQPFAGSSYKGYLINFNNYCSANTATLTFPFSATNAAPDYPTMHSGANGWVGTVTTTNIVIPATSGATNSGYLPLFSY